ncbi:MAG: hypothetical protein ACLU3F_00225 [Blautia wexlerae]
MERLFGHLQEHGCEIPEAVELALAEAVVQDEMQQLKEQEQQLKAEGCKTETGTASSSGGRGRDREAGNTV